MKSICARQRIPLINFNWGKKSVKALLFLFLFVYLYVCVCASGEKCTKGKLANPVNWVWLQWRYLLRIAACTCVKYITKPWYTCRFVTSARGHIVWIFDVANISDFAHILQKGEIRSSTNKLRHQHYFSRYYIYWPTRLEN